VHEDLNATKHVTDRNELSSESKDLRAEGVALREDHSRDNNRPPEADGPSLATGQARFDALLSVGVFDQDRPADWRKAMEQKVSDRFTALSRTDAADFADHRALWLEAAKQVRQEASGRHPAAATTQTQVQSRNENEESRQQTNDSRRGLALTR
jgi:hypothetical protein